MWRFPILIMTLAFLQTPLRSETHALPVHPHSSKWFHIYPLRHIDKSAVKLNVLLVDPVVLPMQGFRVKTSIKNVSKNIIGPISGEGLRPFFRELKEPGNVGPRRYSGYLLSTDLTFLSNLDIETYANWKGIWLRPGQELITIECQVGRTDEHLFRRPGTYQTKIKCGHLDRIESLSIEVAEPKGDDKIVYEILLKDIPLANALVSNRKSTSKEMREKISVLISKYPKSSYADYGRFALACSLYQSGVSLKEQGKEAIAYLEKINYGKFAYGPAAMVLLRRFHSNDTSDEFSRIYHIEENLKKSKEIKRRLQQEYPNSVEFKIDRVSSLTKKQWEEIKSQARKPVIATGTRTVRPPHSTWKLPFGDGVDSMLISPDGVKLVCAPIITGVEFNGLICDLKTWKMKGLELFLRKISLCKLDGKTYLVGLKPSGVASSTSESQPLKWRWNGSGEAYKPLLPPNVKAYAMAISPDGNTLALLTRRVKGVEFWDIKKQTVVATYPTYYPSSLAFSQDGSKVAIAAGNNSIRLWSMSSKKEIATLGRHEYEVTSVTFSPDGRLLASSCRDSTVKLWDIDEQKELVTLRGHRGGVFQVAFSPDGKLLATAGADSCVRLWNTKTHQEIAVLVGHTKEVLTLAFTPDGKMLATGSLDGSAKIWEISNELAKPEYPLRKWTNNTGKFNVDARLVERKQGTVWLEKADGDTISLPLNKLSEADQQYVMEILSAAPFQQWVKQLGDDDFKAREEATRNLIKAGGVALGAVTRATKSKDAEVKQRALRIIKQIEKAAIAYFEKLGGTVKVDEKSPGRPVIELSLWNTKVTDAELVHLKGLTKLQELNLGFTKVTDAGLLHLKRLTGLRELWLRRTKVTHAGIEKLQKALPKCLIFSP